MRVNRDILRRLLGSFTYKTYRRPIGNLYLSKEPPVIDLVLTHIFFLLLLLWMVFKEIENFLIKADKQQDNDEDHNASNDVAIISGKK